jgi:iron(III) transport system substrate-binding protein
MKKLIAFVSLIALLLIPIMTAAETVDPASVTGKIVMYTSDPEEIVTEVLQAFTAKYPNVTYELFRSGTGNLTTKLSSELEAGGTPCNVFSFADFGFLYDWDSKGMIYHWTPEGAANLANEAFKVNGDMGYIYHIECGVIAYNTLFTPEPPKDWFDLTNESLRGLVAFADPGYSGASFSTLVTHIYNSDLVGWDFYEQLKANDLKFEQSNGNLQSKVASGEYSCVAIVDYMARNARDEGAPVEVVYPESGAVMIYSPVCVMSTVKDEDLEAVKLWVEFLLSDEGQAIYTKYNYLPVTLTAPSPANAPTPAELNLMPFDGAFFVENSAEIRAQFESIFAR